MEGLVFLQHLQKQANSLFMTTPNPSTTNAKNEFEQLLEQTEFTKTPNVGDTLRGIVVHASKNEVRLDIQGLATGIVRGYELYNESQEYGNLKKGDEVEATVIAKENENGEIELSFRFAGQKKAWQNLQSMGEKGQVIQAQVVDANKGGLIVKVWHMNGFLPVSQLAPEHYPRVPGGDKTKILEHLKEFINKKLNVKIIDVNERDEKLIVSEKEAWQDMQQGIISNYHKGDIVEGKITAITDFGVFMKFAESLEGLIHISELAWQRVEHPRQVVQVGNHVKAMIINIEGAKIFLSMKKLKEDPWAHVTTRYHVGQCVQGKVLKINPFGLFVELDPEIHGLAHVSELGHDATKNLSEIAKSGDTREFKIISLDPKEHRLGLSIKALQEKEETKSEEEAKEGETHQESQQTPTASKTPPSVTVSTINTKQTEDTLLDTKPKPQEENNEQTSTQETSSTPGTPTLEEEILPKKEE